MPTNKQAAAGPSTRGRERSPHAVARSAAAWGVPWRGHRGAGRGDCPGNATTVIHTDSSSTQGRLRATKCSFPTEKGTVHQRVTGSAGGTWGSAREPAVPATGVPLLSQIVFSSEKGGEKVAHAPEGSQGRVR